MFLLCFSNSIHVCVQIKSGSLKGGVRLLGTPAEEMEGGKINLIESGAFETCDFAMMVHPTREDQAYMTALAMSEFKIRYRGVNAHAAGSPESGVNALDAAVIACKILDLGSLVFLFFFFF